MGDIHGYKKVIPLDAKAYLSQAFRIDQRINSKLEQIMSLRELATKATTTLIDVPSSSTRNEHPMESIIVKIVDLEKEINADIDKLVDLKRNRQSYQNDQKCGVPDITRA